jgi:SAM-dependent methyltransferase
VTDELAAATYAAMRWNTPLSEEHAALVLERLGVPNGSSVLDVGCGWGELLLRAVAAGGPGTTGTGLDSDPQVLTRARALAEERGLGDAVRFLDGAGADWAELTSPADRVICVGSSQAFGDVLTAVGQLAPLVRPGGRLLVGDGVWERPPPAHLATDFAEVPALPQLLERVAVTGWRVLHLSTADQREWDDFESTWRAGRESWLLRHPDDPRAPALRTRLDELLAGYAGAAGYRGILGFAYLVLAR